MSIFKGFLLFLLAIMLHTCGLTAALHNNIFPLRYNLTTTTSFSSDGETRPQTIVTECKVVDQRGSLLTNFVVTVTGERHWTRFPDGSILVLGYLDICKWLEKPPELATRVMMSDDRRQTGSSVGHLLHDAPAYRFDNTDDPGRVRLYSTVGLVAGRSGLVRVSPIQLTVGGATSTRTIDAAFPWLSQMPRVETKRHDSFEQRREAARPVRFIGLRAQLTQLVGGSRCAAGSPDDEGPIAIPPNSACTFVNRCDRGNATTVCGHVIGGLTTTIDPTFTTIRVSAAHLEGALRGDMVRVQKLLDAKAPGEFRHGEFLWSPEVCVEDTCRVMKLSQELSFNERRFMYYPKQNRLLELHPIGYVPSKTRFRAIPTETSAGSTD
jgi:hypothetical protein